MGLPCLSRDVRTLRRGGAIFPDLPGHVRPKRGQAQAKSEDFQPQRGSFHADFWMAAFFGHLRLVQGRFLTSFEPFKPGRRLVWDSPNPKWWIYPALRIFSMGFGYACLMSDFKPNCQRFKLFWCTACSFSREENDMVWDKHTLIWICPA